MSRRALIVLAVLAVAGIGMLAYFRMESRSAESSSTAITNEPVRSQPASTAESDSRGATGVPDMAHVNQAVTAEDVARWTADATSGDAQKRAAAILALSRAPKAEAIPVLRQVAIGGEPQFDRPLALRSLRDIALDQGDADGAVREVVREVIYHGDDEALAQGAQEALDVIEESMLE